MSAPGAYLHAFTAARHQALRVGPFVLGIDPVNALPALSYAVPDAGATPSAEDLDAVALAFTQRDRVPRLEYVPADAPAVEAAALDAGFAIEGRYPVMSATTETARAVEAPPGTAVRRATVASDLRAASEALALAWDDPDPQGPERLRRTMIEGGAVVVATATEDGAPLGAGVLTRPLHGAAEIAGIGVVPTARRRGIAGAMTAALATAAFARNVAEPFLTPGDSTAQRAYERAGFAVAGEVLHLHRPRR